MSTNGSDDIKATNLTDEDRAFIEQHDHLSDSTKRAKWIHSPDEEADRDGQTLATRNHEVIKRWAADKEREAQPATVPGTEHDGRPGVLQMSFDDFETGNLKEISWDDWFFSFDERNLVFLYQERKSDGSPSTFFRLDNPDRNDG